MKTLKISLFSVLILSISLAYAAGQSSAYHTYKVNIQDLPGHTGFLGYNFTNGDGFSGVSFNNGVRTDEVFSPFSPITHQTLHLYEFTMYQCSKGECLPARISRSSLPSPCTQPIAPGYTFSVEGKLGISTASGEYVINDLSCSIYKT